MIARIIGTAQQSKEVWRDFKPFLVPCLENTRGLRLDPAEEHELIVRPEVCGILYQRSGEKLPDRFAP